MSKNNFLLLSLEDDRAKDIANIVSSKTAKKILKYLSEKEDATETQISKDLDVAISTIHYNLEQLKKARLLEWKKYHYSEKGKEVRHYNLTNKYIIIAPKNSDEGFLEQLKNIIPTLFVSIAGAGIVFFFANDFPSQNSLSAKMVSADVVLKESTKILSSEPSLSFFQLILNNSYLMFISGTIFALIVYFIIKYVRRNYFN